MTSGNFYHIDWDLNGFNPDEIGLPTLVFETYKNSPFLKEAFNPNKVFILDRDSYPDNYLITDILSDTFRTTVLSITLA